MIKAKGRVLSRDYLLDNIWGFDHAMDIQTRTVDVHIRTLRKKLKTEAKRIIIVHGHRIVVVGEQQKSDEIEEDLAAPRPQESPFLSQKCRPTEDDDARS